MTIYYCHILEDDGLVVWGVDESPNWSNPVVYEVWFELGTAKWHFAIWHGGPNSGGWDAWQLPWPPEGPEGLPKGRRLYTDEAARKVVQLAQKAFSYELPRSRICSWCARD